LCAALQVQPARVQLQASSLEGPKSSRSRAADSTNHRSLLSLSLSLSSPF
jgi:hypothetical protein